MNPDEIASALTTIKELVVTQQAAMRQELLELSQCVEEVLRRDLRSRLAITDQLLIEERARVRNVLALHEARFNALNAYLAGEDVQSAFVEAREVFRNAEPTTFDPVLWRVDADWLVALRQRRG